MASTIVTFTENIVRHPMVVAAVTAAAVDIAALQAGSSEVSTAVNAGATLAVTSAHNNNVIALNHATASAVTLPAATGTGMVYKFVVTVVPSGSHTIAVTGNDTFFGGLMAEDADTGNATKTWFAAAGDNRITLNHGTQGAVTVGEQFEVLDFAADKWHVSGAISQTGSVATPFSTV